MKIFIGDPKAGKWNEETLDWERIENEANGWGPFTEPDEDSGWKPDPARPFQKLTPTPIKYIKKAKELAYGFALMYDRDVDVVGEDQGENRYVYGLYLNFDCIPEDHPDNSYGKYVRHVVTPAGAKMRAAMIQRKEKANEDS